MMAFTSRRALGWCAVLAAGVLLLAPGESQAQRGRGYGGYRGGSGWGMGSGYASPGYGYGGRYGSFYGPGYGAYSPGYGYYSPGYTYSGTTPYAYNYPYTYSQGSVATPTYSYTYPQATMGTSTVTESLYRPAVPANAARVTVLLPSADAQVFVQGQPMTSAGATREFVSPSLTPGESYTYEIRAVWNQGGQQVDQTRSVRVRANEVSTADFRTAPANALPSTPAAPLTTTPPPPPAP